jgi:hypothetical protein
VRLTEANGTLGMNGLRNLERPLNVCAVTRRRFPVGASILRVPAADVETLVAEALGKLSWTALLRKLTFASSLIVS